MLKAAGAEISTFGCFMFINILKSVQQEEMKSWGKW